MRRPARLVGMFLLLAAAGGIAWVVYRKIQQQAAPAASAEARPPAPVEVAPIRRGAIELRRSFSGTLEATAEFVVAPKVAGRVERLSLDLGDAVQRGQVVAWLDDDEFLQSVAQAEAELAVAQANRVEARSALEVATRDLQRFEMLRESGVSSESQYDVAQAERLAKEARLAVAEAQVKKAEAALESARIRLGYTQVQADWSGGGEERWVSERHVDEGETVSANSPLLAIVELHPITGVIYAAEKDYPRLERGQAAVLTTDAHPGEEFAGRIARIAPVFRAATRQARVELVVDNADRRLKPGMFIRVTVVLERVAEATLVPEAALTSRGDRTGVFVVSEGGATARWRPVTAGIRQDGLVQVEGEGLAGQVVTLGQQLIDDGSPIAVPGQGDAAAPGGAVGSIE